MTPGNRLNDDLPACNDEDPAELESFYGPGGFVDALRKICLSNCREIERAKALAGQEKVTESRLDDLAHTNDIYVGFIVTHLQGRKKREENVLSSLRNGA
jgi:hypothetical protein